MAKDNFIPYFNLEGIEKIKRLNDKLKKEEKRIYEFSFKLEYTLNKMIAEKQIDDYNVFQRIELFSSNAECNKRNKVTEGIPILNDETFNLFYFNNEDMFHTENWNELEPKHPLGKLEFCYTMHCLCFHSRLSWLDLINVDDVWIELKVEYQFVVKGV